MGKFKEKDIENLNKEENTKDFIIDILFYFLLTLAIILLIYHIYSAYYIPTQPPLDWNFTITE